MADIPKEVGLLVRCDTCNGEGYHDCQRECCNWPGARAMGHRPRRVRCWDCHGTGRVPEGTAVA